MFAIAFLFSVSLGVAVYVYFGYPLLLVLLNVLRDRPVHPADIEPRVSVIIPTYNEESSISAKLENTLELDYPIDKLEVVVVSDGSTDSTEETVRAFTDRGVRLVPLPRSGKAEALNRGGAEAAGDILLFTDANAALDRSAVRRLARNFADPTVGGVCGNQHYRLAGQSDTAGAGENLYWRYDKWIKQQESSIGSAVAADGSIYAIRRNLFVPIADPAQADDLAISARVVTQGYRLVFDPTAISFEDAPASSESEFRRKVRVANHTLRAMILLWPELTLRRHKLYVFELVSHKLLRYAVPWCLLTALVCNAALAPKAALYATLLIGQGIFYGSALAGWVGRRHRWGRSRALSGPFYFCLANAAVFLGVLSALRGERFVAWQPQRTAPKTQSTGK